MNKRQDRRQEKQRRGPQREGSGSSSQGASSAGGAARPARGARGTGRVGADGRSERPQSSRPAPEQAPPITAWTEEAAWYDRLVGESGSEYQREVVFPGVMRLLKLSSGERVLDVACGQGALDRLMHQAGASVTGVDASPELIQLARQQSDPAISFHIGDACALEKIEAIQPGSFTAATCVLAVQNMHPLPPLMQGVARALAERGRFVIAMMHPCFRGPKTTSWGWDDPRKGGKVVQYRRVDRYLLPRKEPIITHPGSDPTRYTWTFHRPLQAYVKALRNAGLVIDAIEEWPSHKISQPGPRAAAENVAREEIPMFMAIRAVKAAVGS